MYEIQSSRLALERSKNLGLQAAAKMIIADHPVADAQLKALVDLAFAAATAHKLEKHAEMVTTLDRSPPADDEAGAGRAAQPNGVARATPP